MLTLVQYKSLVIEHGANNKAQFSILFVLLGQACSALGGFAPNPSDCSSFLVCNHDKYIVQPCAIGLHWDNKIKACNTIELAGCEPGMYIFFPLKRVTYDL